MMLTQSPVSCQLVFLWRRS